MDREYDLFEHMPDGSFQWRGVERGLEQARLKLCVLSCETGNECFAMYVPSEEIVAIVSAAKPKVA
jgi:hypothetical protein